MKHQNAYSTPDSQAVSDPSTNGAQRCLTWQIGRDAVFSTWYGRKREVRMCAPESIQRLLPPSLHPPLQVSSDVSTVLHLPLLYTVGKVICIKKSLTNCPKTDFRVF